MRFIRLLLPTLLVALLSGCAKNTKELESSFSKMSSVELYNMAKVQISEKKYLLAIKSLEALEEQNPYGEYAEKAHVNLTYAYLKKRDNAQVVASAARFEKIYPRSKSLDYITYLKGMAYFNEHIKIPLKRIYLDKYLRDAENAQKAFNIFAELIDSYPNSKYLPIARQRMIYLKNEMAKHHLEISKFYYRKKAYLASIKISEKVISEFSNTEAAQQALKIREDSYKKLSVGNK